MRRRVHVLIVGGAVSALLLLAFLAVWSESDGNPDGSPDSSCEEEETDLPDAIRCPETDAQKYVERLLASYWEYGNSVEYDTLGELRLLETLGDEAPPPELRPQAARVRELSAELVEAWQEWNACSSESCRDSVGSRFFETLNEVLTEISNMEWDVYQ